MKALIVSFTETKAAAGKYLVPRPKSASLPIAQNNTHCMHLSKLVAVRKIFFSYKIGEDNFDGIEKISYLNNFTSGFYC